MKSLIVSADDYAQSAAIDAGILSLIQQKRITAASCLTLSPRWTQAAKLITSDIRKQADIGLHLDFTQYPQPLKNSLPALIVRTLSHSLSSKEIQTSINAQLNHFEDALGTAPDYIDGHQHVHQLPQIRKALIEVISSRYTSNLPWVRIAKPPLQDGFKAFIIGLLGANALAKLCKKAGLRCTDSLLGVYGFDENALAYQQRLAGWLASAQQSPTALMCHPALATESVDSNDPIYNARLIEYQVFSDTVFMNLLNQYGVQLVRGGNYNNSHKALAPQIIKPD